MDEYSDKHFLKGFGFLAENNIARALDEFSNVLMQKNDNLEIYASMGSLFRRNGDYAKAVHIHESALSSPKLPGSLKKYIQFELVKDYRAWGQNKQAKYYLDDLSKHDKSPVLVKILAEINFEQENYEEAEKLFHKYEKISHKDYSDWRAYCIYKQALKETQDKQKVKLLEKSLKISPGLRIVNLEYIRTLFAGAQKEKGISAVNSFIENDLALTEDDLNEMREYYYDYKDVKDFDQLIMRKVSAKTENPFYILFMAEYFIKKDDLTRAKEIIKDFINEHGSFKSLLKKYSQIHLDSVFVDAFINEPEYKCSSCGTLYNDYHTICANCKSLEKIKPV
jgi:lipopolysaccharide biosynthesis regulator YciM